MQQGHVGVATKHFGSHTHEADRTLFYQNFHSQLLQHLLSNNFESRHKDLTKTYKNEK
jgi:hypothetical protein